MNSKIKLSKYRILGLVGQGQFGRVFCGCHRKTGQLFALKDLDPHRFPTNKFLRELRFLLSLKHPNIVACHALEHSSTGRYLVMDYCNSGTLRTLMESEGKLSLLVKLKLVADILTGLDCAHHHSIVHRDIKPDNILLSLRSDGWIARISDFGIARLSQELIERSENTGSPAYMAPERFYGQYSVRSDIYAVGVMLFELLVGDRPFSGAPTELMSAHLNQSVKIPREVPDSLQSIILTALQKLPARRFHSAGEMLEAIQQVQVTLASTEVENPPQRNALISNPPSLVSICSLEKQYLQTSWNVTAPITALGVVSADISQQTGSCGPNLKATNKLYCAAGSTVECEIYPEGILQGENVERVAFGFKESVRRLIGCQSGCLAIAERSIYWLDSDRRSAQEIAHLDGDFVADLEPQGSWMVVATSDRQLKILNLRPWVTGNCTSSIDENICKIFPVTGEVSQLLVLNSRHLVAIAPEKTTTLLEIFTRRGSSVGSYRLPAVLGKAIATQTPYQLLATEPSNQTLLLIDLKPYRLQRLPIGISQPQLLDATAWGYILGNTQGEIVLLDIYGQVIGLVEATASILTIEKSENNASRNGFQLCAIASFDNIGLAIATTNSKQGWISAVDLRQLDIDLVF